VVNTFPEKDAARAFNKAVRQYVRARETKAFRLSKEFRLRLREAILDAAKRVLAGEWEVVETDMSTLARGWDRAKKDLDSVEWWIGTEVVLNAAKAILDTTKAAWKAAYDEHLAMKREVAP
jgi:hypothetical protein